MGEDMRELEARRKAFRKALALAELTMEKWCAEEGITYGHLYHVLSGRRESASLMRRVDAFCAQYRPAGSAAPAA